jgi:hypothetical protein
LPISLERATTCPLFSGLLKNLYIPAAHHQRNQDFDTPMWQHCGQFLEEAWQCSGFEFGMVLE